MDYNELKHYLDNPRPVIVLLGPHALRIRDKLPTDYCLSHSYCWPVRWFDLSVSVLRFFRREVLYKHDNLAKSSSHYYYKAYRILNAEAELRSRIAIAEVDKVEIEWLERPIESSEIDTPEFRWVDRREVPTTSVD